MHPDFLYTLGQEVIIALSGEKGVVIGRAQYASGIIAQYQVEYLDVNGAYQERWLGEDKLQGIL